MLRCWDVRFARELDYIRSLAACALTPSLEVLSSFESFSVSSFSCPPCHLPPRTSLLGKTSTCCRHSQKRLPLPGPLVQHGQTVAAGRAGDYIAASRRAGPSSALSSSFASSPSSPSSASSPSSPSSPSSRSAPCRQRGWRPPHHIARWLARGRVDAYISD